MNRRSEIDRVLQVWMEDGPTAIPDRVVDVVAARIGVQRQRRAWPFQGRTIVTPFKLAAALVAAIVVAVIGYSLLPRQPSVGGPTTAPSPSAAPTSSPVVTGPVVLHDGVLTAGRYRLQPVDEPSTIRIVADVPAGWEGVGAGALLKPGGILIGFMVPDRLFSDPCQWDLNGTGLEQPGDVVVGPTVDDLVAALKANTSYTSTTATPISFGQFQGQELELQLPGDAVLSTCDKHGEGSSFSGTAYYVFEYGFYAQGPNSLWHLYIVDVGGTRLVTMISIEEGTLQADITAAQALVESFEITP